MKTRMRWIALLGLFALIALPGVAADAVEMKGGYVWEKDDGNHEGELKAVLTPTGKGTWDVSFHFDWEDGPHVYTGTCSGSLENGEFTGNITSDGEREMKFKFGGQFKNGKFSGVHHFVGEDGETQRAGTLSLGS